MRPTILGTMAHPRVWSTTTIVIFLIAAVATAQDTTPCESYSHDGSGVCNGVHVNVGKVLCAKSFIKSRCSASRPQSNGYVQTFYFRGVGLGLPIGNDIASDCASSDFPAGGGVAMAQTFQNNGQPSGCYPAADVAGTKMYYTRGETAGSLASVTVVFGVHTDGTGTQRDGFITIKCVKGGPTDNFQYSTIGDEGHQSVYEIDTAADCEHSGDDDELYVCKGGDCVQAPTGKGVSKAICESACIGPSKYVCVDGQCVPSNDSRGVDKTDCQQLCG
eukprot:m.145963 g.145963  ORF g.145963 m.145963 type:complete len:275 (-) comp11637_c1_seq4:50-874(-)